MINPEVDFKFAVEKVSESPNVFRTAWLVPADLSYLDGHFPGNPILPAVGVLDASLELVKKALKNDKIELHHLRSAKFMQSISPGHTLEICSTEQIDSRWQVEWKLLPEGKSAAELVFEVRACGEVRH